VGEAASVHDWLADHTGYRFKNPALLEQALAHRSWCAENDNAPSNERLEFLGDAVLGWVVADLVVAKYPDLPEGALTDLRKALVNAETLASIAGDLDLGRWLLLGAGEENAGGRGKTSILADALEAVIGALYLDGGVAKSRSFVRKLVSKRMREVAKRLHLLDSRSLLIRVCTREFGRPPVVETTSSGAAHEPTFGATIVVEGEAVASGRGRSKKAAIQDASARALDVLTSRGVDISRA